MVRRPEGWKLYKDERTGIWYVRFRHEKKRHDLSTGERDPDRAPEQAARIYAEVVSGRWDRQRVEAPRPGAPLEDTVAQWLADVKAEVCLKTWKLYKIHMWAHIIPFFISLDRVTDMPIVDFRRARLRKVVRATIIKEQCTLRRFCTWCVAEKYMAKMPVIEAPAKTSLGTPDTKAPHKEGVVELSHEESKAIIDRLPEMSKRARRGKGKHAVKDAFVVYWETGLRPATIARLECPRHYHKGAAEIDITADIDKSRYDRPLPLTDACRAALDRWAPDIGLIFGEHDYRVPFAQAAAKAAADGLLSQHKADRVSPYDFRHGRTTELANNTNNLSGVSYLVGHRKVSTTALYVHAPKHAAAAVLESVTGGIRVAKTPRRGDRKRNPSKTSCEGGDLNPYENNPASTSKRRKKA